MALGSGRRDTTGLNQGLYELASGAEVVAYFDRVTNQRSLPRGRLSYQPTSTDPQVVGLSLRGAVNAVSE